MLLTSIAVFLITLCSAINAFCLPTQDFWIPQTYTLSPSSFKFDIQSQFSADKRSTDFASQYHQSSFGIAFGLFEKSIVGVEGGLDWKEPAPKSVEAALYGHLRARVNNVDKDGWALAFGVHSLGLKANVNDYNVTYLVLQHMFAEDWITEVGGFVGSNKLLLNENHKGDSNGGLFGLWRKFSGGKFALEWHGGQNLFGYTFIGTMVDLKQAAQGYLGYGIASNKTDYRDWILFRITVDY